MLGCPHPRHELVEQRGGPEVDEPGEHVGEIGLRIGAVQFASLDERSDAGPVLRSLIMTGEERARCCGGRVVVHDRDQRLQRISVIPPRRLG
jgi:hypothetical protein